MSSLPVPHKLEALREIVHELGSVVVCFSGGIDSALVLAVAHEQLAEGCIGLTAVSPSLPAQERTGAAALATQLGVRHETVESNEIARPGYAENGPDRCFHCKSELYTIAEAKRREWGLRWIANGSNQDDKGDYRPGLQAAATAGVRSPLMEADMTKDDVRAAARALGLEIWDKPAAACLSSRIPYGSRVTRERLAQIEEFEAGLAALGFSGHRVRWHETVARIEVAPQDLPRLVEDETRERTLHLGRRCGFRYITVDLAGYRTGSLNEVLDGRRLRLV